MLATLMKRSFLVIFLFAISQSIQGQCDPEFSPSLSPRIANYEMHVDLDHEAKMIEAKEHITWINSSPDTLEEIRMYMYLNAFKNTSTTFLHGIGNMFGDDMSKRQPHEWGWIEVNEVSQKGSEGIISLEDQKAYIQPDDGNPHDQSVLQIKLTDAVLPGDTLLLNLNFTAKMPKTVVRSGYSKDDFFLFVHWFPQLGVYEQDTAGNWGWNCHQFHRSTEFYSDFGTYEVTIKAADHLVLGASGCLMEESYHDDGTILRTYYVEDVIDFAWTAYPCFDIFEEEWNDIQIRLLIPQEHSHLADRYLLSMRQSLEYLHEHVGPYPYPIITIMDPPVHALRSGMMEYPTFITCGSFAQIPEGLRSLEGLVAHEFCHQYFMGMLASNEKEEAWLDEGLVTYFEDRIIDHYYGEKGGYYDLWGYRSGNKEKTRTEYTGMPNPKIGIGALPGWELDRNSYKQLVYAKTATTLHSLQGILGDETTDIIFQRYFEQWKFKHPRGGDFIAVVNEVVKERHGDQFGENMDWLFEQCIYDTKVCDYAVDGIFNVRYASGQGIFDQENGGKVYQSGKLDEQLTSTVTLVRLGELIFPLDVEIVFKDGSKKTEYWSGVERKKEFSYLGSVPIVSAHIDPQQKVLMDLNLLNNSKTLQPSKAVRNKYVIKSIFWIQTLLQTFGNII